MIDGLWSGLLGGFLGPVVAKIIGKFSYWKVFVFMLACIYIFIFSVAIFKSGVEKGFSTAVAISLGMPGALVPIGFAAVFAFCAFLQVRSGKKG
ncbi:hypothetical protein LGN21_23015 [Burkholderia cepacia]|uniref:hypothetical protein n=1 Tax=Burkholderia cepacia TaxID=292 RepID=UPI001CF49209|nr:hypothetical protein [Burkholderia cepacia]MCA8282466.1 hypothetical protein [Burkholderia cepacia]